MKPRTSIKVMVLCGLFLGLPAPRVRGAQADGWVTPCVDCPKSLVPMTDRDLRWAHYAVTHYTAYVPLVSRALSRIPGRAGMR
jgi:hypothetical protein